MGHFGHDHHAMMIADFKKRFYVVLALTVPILLLSRMIQHFFGFHWQFPASPYILASLSTIVYLYGGLPFLKGLVDEAKARNPGMMFLIGYFVVWCARRNSAASPTCGRRWSRTRATPTLIGVSPESTTSA